MRRREAPKEFAEVTRGPLVLYVLWIWTNVSTHSQNPVFFSVFCLANNSLMSASCPHITNCEGIDHRPGSARHLYLCASLQSPWSATMNITPTSSTSISRFSHSGPRCFSSERNPKFTCEWMWTNAQYLWMRHKRNFWLIQDYLSWPLFSLEKKGILCCCHCCSFWFFFRYQLRQACTPISSFHIVP